MFKKYITNYVIHSFFVLSICLIIPVVTSAQPVTTTQKIRCALRPALFFLDTPSYCYETTSSRSRVRSGTPVEFQATSTVATSTQVENLAARSSTSSETSRPVVRTIVSSNTQSDTDITRLVNSIVNNKLADIYKRLDSQTSGNAGFSYNVLQQQADAITRSSSRTLDDILTNGSQNLNSQTVSVSGLSSFMGNVGIGTTTPDSPLTVVGNTSISGNLIANQTTLTKGALYLLNPTSPDKNWGISYRSDRSLLFYAYNTDHYYDWNGFANNLTLTEDGKMGLRTTTPGSTLSVGGSSGNGFTGQGNVSIGSSYANIAAPVNGLIVQGNVGIGTSTPGHVLDVVGDVSVTGTSSALVMNIASTTLGYQLNGQTVLRTWGVNSLSLGTNNSLADGSGVGNNLFLGINAGSSTSSGFQNTFIGLNAGKDTTTGFNNIFIGQQAGQLNIGGSSNTFIGLMAGSSATSSANANVFVGQQTGMSFVSGSANSFFGMQTGLGATGGSNNTFVGYRAGNVNAVGGDNNTFMGYLAGAMNTTGYGNTFIGQQSGGVFVGNTTGFHNTFLGMSSGNTNSTGSENLLMGYNADVATGNLTNAIAIGSHAVVGVSNSLILGGTGAYGVNVGIGTTTPTAQLSTTGSVRFANFGAGTLQTDANGNLSVSSDERLKNIQGNFTSGLSAIEQLNPINYKWKPETGYDASSTYTGFSAQNVQLAIPEAVGLDKNGFLTLQDRPILAALVNAVKELSNIVENIGSTLKDKVVEMKEAVVGTLRINDKVCVDDVCVTKEQFKQMLLNNNGTVSTPSTQTETTTPVPITTESTSTTPDPVVEETPTSTPTVTPEVAPVSVPVEIPVISEPAPDPAPTEFVSPEPTTN